MSLDTARVRKDFPILQTTVRGRPLVYLDTAASAQKPQPVLDALQDFYAHHYANIHRGVYQLSADATARYEAAREKVRAFIGAAEAREIVFVRNTTEAINLVAASFGGARVGAGDEVLITALEHHANLVPWQQLCLARKATLRVAEVDDAGRLDPARFEALLGERTRLCAITHVSNAIGARLPVRELIRRAHAHGVPVLVDGAQAAPRFALDVRELGADFYAFSGHKLYGPSGIGVLYGRAQWLDAMPPWQTGGGMIERVRFESTTFAKIPERFEAGTPDIAGAVALGAAVDYLRALGMHNIERHEAALLTRAAELLRAVPGLAHHRRRRHRRQNRRALVRARRHSPARHRHRARR